ncbi:hypothetical protein [Nesterenkonia muleiensis]|uniref:hypothetical protein n=1 Tax=Nesterenkonia muleiensis TaxID=2282648 RepID=UPI0013004A7C|nr:hypothetical protein [Nesterenkonia muleiensis]
MNVNDDKRIAAYVAGDNRIFFPALVALKELENHNPERFDKFIVFDGSLAIGYEADLMEKAGIKFLDARDVSSYDLIAKSSAMIDRDWPLEVMLNWAVPEYLGSMGYGHSLKLDYDALPVQTFSELDRLINSRMKVSFRTAAARSVAVVNDRASLGTGWDRIDPERPVRQLNAGVALFDNRAIAEVSEEGFFAEVMAIYDEIMTQAPATKTIEQVALAYVCDRFGSDFVDLPHAMNSFAREWNARLEVSAMEVIHFLGKPKPWQPLEPRLLYRYVTRMKLMPYLRDIWLSAASRVEGFEDFTNQRASTPLERLQLAIWMETERSQHRKKVQERISKHLEF